MIENAGIIHLAISLVTAFGAGVSAYVGLRIANTENRRDLAGLKEAYVRLEASLRIESDRAEKKLDALQKDLSQHTHVEHHVSKNEVARIETALTEFSRTNLQAHEALGAKIDRLADRLAETKK